MTAIQRIDAADVVVGDLLWFLGQTHRVTSIDVTRRLYAYDRDPNDWRTAREEPTGWTYTLIPGEMVEVLA